MTPPHRRIIVDVLNLTRVVTLSLLAGAALASAGFAADQPQTWVADPRHSSAQFTITHLGISHVRGVIPITSAVIAGGSPQLPARIDATLDASGIDTRNDQRDNDLKSPHFFDASRYPSLTFTSTSISPIDSKNFTVAGNLTLHGVTRPVTLKGTFLGQMVGERGDAHAAYEATTSIKRSDFGMTYLPYVVGDDVDIDIDIEAVARK
jgi:polyisoprenoid-binding protein YceI